MKTILTLISIALCTLWFHYIAGRTRGAATLIAFAVPVVAFCLGWVTR